jgi:hypothetical protein
MREYLSLFDQVERGDIDYGMKMRMLDVLSTARGVMTPEEEARYQRISQQVRLALYAVLPPNISRPTQPKFLG